MAEPLTIADVEELEHRRHLNVDWVVDVLTEDGGACYSREVAVELLDLQPDLWADLRGCVPWVRRWLVAAEERGELVSELRPASGKGRWARRYYRRPGTPGGGKVEKTLETQFTTSHVRGGRAAPDLEDRRGADGGFDRVEPGVSRGD